MLLEEALFDLLSLVLRSGGVFSGHTGLQWCFLKIFPSNTEKAWGDNIYFDPKVGPSNFENVKSTLKVNNPTFGSD